MDSSMLLPLGLFFLAILITMLVIRYSNKKLSARLAELHGEINEIRECVKKAGVETQSEKAIESYNSIPSAVEARNMPRVKSEIRARK